MVLEGAGSNALASVTKKLTSDIPSLHGKIISDKSGRTTGITRMIESSVLTQYGMETSSGHCDAESYEKYNLVAKMLRDRASQRNIHADHRPHGSLLSFDEIYRQEVAARLLTMTNFRMR